MNKYIALFFSASFFLCACKGSKAPEGVIDHNQMISMLTEFHIVDGTMYNLNQSPDSLYKNGMAKYLILFKKHHTDSAQFRKSMMWYATQPTELEKMYEQVALNLKQKQDSLNKINIHVKHALPAE